MFKYSYLKNGENNEQNCATVPIKTFLIQSYEKLKLCKKLHERGYLELTKYVYRLDDFIRDGARGG